MSNCVLIYESSLNCIRELAAGILDEIAVATPDPPKGGIEQCLNVPTIDIDRIHKRSDKAA
jgi:hypothetical protein